MLSRRHFFVGALGIPAAAMLRSAPLALVRPRRAAALARDLASVDGEPEAIARDERFWFEVGQAFTVDRSLVNLNNGGVSPSPAVVQEAMKRRLDHSNSAPAHVLWNLLEPQREGVRARLARQWGVDAEEVAITRNASEGLQTCQFGIDLRAGDEVLATTQDYPRMIATFRQRERREGIVLRQFALPIPAEDPAAVVALYERHLTPRTKLILCSHVVNLTGQVLPVRDIVALGRRHGVPVVIDGAHSLAHLEFSISELDCDYFATSLHKWLFAPHGTGMLYVRRDRVRGLWPLMAAPVEMDANVRKFEEIGTHPAANALAIAEALTFHQGLGGRRKEARLRLLRDTWARRLLETGRVTLRTSLLPGLACGIATFEVEGLDAVRLNAWLWDAHRILTTAIVHPEIRGIRVSPSVYTTPEELDRFASAIEHAIRHGLPA